MAFRKSLKHFLSLSSRPRNTGTENPPRDAGESHAAKYLIKNLKPLLRPMKRRLETLEGTAKWMKHLDPALFAWIIRLWYQNKTGRVLDLKNPKTYNEKIQWMKVYDRDPRKTLLADKLLVRDWVREKIGESYLIPLLGVYRTADEIDFDSLPNSFVLKANHGSGMNCIVRDKAEENLSNVRHRAQRWLATNYTFQNGYELHYIDIPRRLIAEKYMENPDGEMPDYKFWCFDGKCRIIAFMKNRKKGLKMAFFDTDWNKLPYYYIGLPIEEQIPKPRNLKKMIEIAEKLAADFPHVRVDLYLLDDGEIKFGEMTFTSASGACCWNPPEADLWVGEMFKLPKSE